MGRLILLALIVGLAGAYFYKPPQRTTLESIAQTSGNPTLNFNAFSYRGADDPAAFAKEIKTRSAGKVLFVMVSAAWCGNCKAQRGFLENIIHQQTYNLNVLELDYEAYPKIGAVYKRMKHIPENHIYYNGREIYSSMGRAKDEASLIQEITQVAAKNSLPFKK